MKLLKKDIPIVAAVVLAAAILLLFGRAPANTADEVVIFVDDAEYKRLPYGEPATVVITHPDGGENVIEITENGVYMKSSTCQNQNCIKQGCVTPENAAGRALGGWIICLPNGVSVQLTEGEAK